MREILFRGKRIDNGEWVEGSLAASNGLINIGRAYILPSFTNLYSDRFSEARIGNFIEVYPNTVGQYTGLCDKNGKKIFEGDIVNIRGDKSNEDWKHVNYNALIAFIDGGFCALDGTIKDHGFRRYALARMDFDLEVIGTIHDNPELLKGE